MHDPPEATPPIDDARAGASGRPPAEPAPREVGLSLPWHSWALWRRWMLRALAIVALWQLLIIAAIVSAHNTTPISFVEVARIIRHTFTHTDIGPGVLLWIMLGFTALAMKPGATAPRDRAGFVLIILVLPLLVGVVGFLMLAGRPIALLHWITLRGTDSDYTIAACLIGPALWMRHCWRPVRESQRISNLAYVARRVAQERERLRLARERQVCQACNYSLAGLPAGALCPECGAHQVD